MDKLLTEKRNPKTMDIDSKATIEILRLINEEDRTVADAIASKIPDIARAVECYVESLKSGGRIFYVGAGTSGRLGIIDAAECPPTFSSPPELIQGLIAGGPEAVFRAKEGAEDHASQGAKAIADIGVSERDVVVGLAASGRTPWVVGALRKAKEIGARTVTIDCTTKSEIADLGEISVSVHVGPEVITGSTRMKAATAQKMILNMLSTTAMIRLGKVYGNLMVDLQPWSEKLRSRSKSILKTVAGVSDEEAEGLLAQSRWNVKVALVMAKTGKNKKEAEDLLSAGDGFVRRAIELGGGKG